MEGIVELYVDEENVATIPVSDIVSTAAGGSEPKASHAALCRLALVSSKIRRKRRTPPSRRRPVRRPGGGAAPSLAPPRAPIAGGDVRSVVRLVARHRRAVVVAAGRRRRVPCADADDDEEPLGDDNALTAALEKLAASSNGASKKFLHVHAAITSERSGSGTTIPMRPARVALVEFERHCGDVRSSEAGEARERPPRACYYLSPLPPNTGYARRERCAVQTSTIRSGELRESSTFGAENPQECPDSQGGNTSAVVPDAPPRMRHRNPMSPVLNLLRVRKCAHDIQDFFTRVVSDVVGGYSVLASMRFEKCPTVLKEDLSPVSTHARPRSHRLLTYPSLPHMDCGAGSSLSESVVSPVGNQHAQQDDFNNEAHSAPAAAGSSRDVSHAAATETFMYGVRRWIGITTRISDIDDCNGIQKIGSCEFRSMGIAILEDDEWIAL